MPPMLPISVSDPNLAAPPPPRSLALCGLVNRLSGGQAGARVFAALSSFKALDALADLSQGGPRPLLEELASANEAGAANGTVLVFGGDGTFNWVAATVLSLRALYPAFRPNLVPCPLGTGNDLARVLGWGVSFPGAARLPAFVRAAADARPEARLDVWRVRFALHPTPFPYMVNYFSVGVDAEVSRRFDVARTASPGAFRSQLQNKVRYALLGASLVFTGAASLGKRVAALEVDGKAVPLPAGLKSILVLNIPSYGGGTHPWGDDAPGACLTRSDDAFQPAATDDARLEVVGLFGVGHAASLHVRRRAGALRLAQGSRIELRFLGASALEAAGHADKLVSRPALAAQTDGEPFSFPAAGEVVTITHAGRVDTPLGPSHPAARGRRGPARWPHARLTGAEDVDPPPHSVALVAGKLHEPVGV